MRKLRMNCDFQPSPSQPESLPQHLGWANMLEVHLKQFDRPLYNNLKKSGELKEYYLSQANQASDLCDLLKEKGLSEFEAQHIAMRRYIWPGTDDD